VINFVKAIYRIIAGHLRQHPHLRHAIYAWMVALIALMFLCSCATSQTWQHYCVANSIRDAWSYEMRTGNPARIAISKIKPGVDHAQAMGQMPDGSWKYLTMHNNDGLLREWERQSHSEPYRYLTLDDFIQEQVKHRHPGK
jgi:hypothetical protein